MLCRWWW